MTETPVATLATSPWRSLPFETARELTLGPLPSASAAAGPDTSSLNARKRRQRKASKHSRDTSTTSLSCDPIPPPSASPSSSTLPNVFANSTIPSNISVHSAAPPSMEPARENAHNEGDVTLLLGAWLRLLDDFVEWYPPPNISTPDELHVYLDGLQIEPSPFDQDPDFSLVLTPYSTPDFQRYLDNAGLLARYPELCFKITHSFPLGDLAPILESFTPNNLPSANDHMEVIREYISEELALGRFTGPFTRAQLETKIGPFRSSPLQVATKISSALLGTQAVTLDIAGAYHMVPVKPDHKRFLVVFFLSFFYMDHNVPFGLASASGLQGEIADATVDVWESLAVSPIVKWVDDFTLFRFPCEIGPFVEDGFRYRYDLTYAKELIAPLCIPWHSTKDQEFANSFDYVGFHWDIAQRTVSLSERKRLKYSAHLLLFLQTYENSQVPKKEAERIIGKLSHITFVHSRGRLYMSNLYAWLRTFHTDFIPCYMRSSIISDLKWWLTELSIPFAPRSLTPHGPTRDYGIWVDASTSMGIGIIWNGHWAAWRAVDGWKVPGRDIGWLEGVAAEIAILIAYELGIRDAGILIRSDNEGVIGAFEKGRSNNAETNLCIRRSEEVFRVTGLSASLIYPPSSPMNDSSPIAHLLQDVDIDAEAAAFFSQVNSDVRHVATLPPSGGHVRIPRRPSSLNCIAPSSHRPLVLASDRVLLWTTPHSHSFQRSLDSLLPSTAVLKLFQVMLCSLDESTHGAGLLRFTQYCDQHRIPELQRMPASESLLSTFAASAAGAISDNTLSNWLAGLHFWHTINGAVWHGHDMLRHVRRGIAKLVPPDSKRAKHPPVTIEAMVILKDGLDLSNVFDAAVWALVSIAFWCCCRLGELVIPSTNLFDPLKHVSRSVLPIAFDRLANGAEFATFHIPWTKTTLQEGADISITARIHSTCPLVALRHHLSCNIDIPTSAPLFAFETAAGGWSPMTKHWFMQCCNTIWVSAGFPDMPGHAFRIGGATELLLQGVNPDVVATQGRWKSQAFLEYWRRIESILPLFISNASHSSRALHIGSAMDSFSRRHRLVSCAPT
ncbi:hypothetical protein SCP_0213370 [Sparassis crispa]|uniref:Reverse transcriptase domain-containing protein n=1 Tax=Sparassis crispa TaxID=139825 RepID=A0A401GD73_9APHY|nr:hypothetical protein SCP_0213370 [Sparassis crispa]GBE80134.1 hypothetical protein SCP_0213370 [Sparassis crispa]